MCLMRISPLQKLFYYFDIDLKVKVAKHPNKPNITKDNTSLLFQVANAAE